MKQIFVILLFFTTQLYSSAQTVSSQKVVAATYPLTGHPRLYFLSTDEAALRLKINGTASLLTIQNVILSECEKICLLAPKTRVISGNRILDVSREVLRRVGFLSFAARITTDAALKTKYANRAIQEMLSAASFTDWLPDSDFLGTSEMTLALALGYDWLYNFPELDSTEKTTIAAAIKSKGIEQTMGANLVKCNWLNYKNNWNQVCNAGISAGVAAVYDENPTLYKTLIDRAITSIKIPMGEYKHNGSFSEGFMYWDYGTSFNVLFIDLLNKMWGSDSGLSALPGFMKTGEFITNLQGNATKQFSSGKLNLSYPRSFNFSDCFIYNPLMPSLYWFASQDVNSSYLFNEYNKLKVTSLVTNSAKDHRLLPFLLIWSKDLSLTNLTEPVNTSYICAGANPVATFRTGWGDNDIYLAIKGGVNSNSHGHLDAGSFVMDMNDVRWAMDFGMSNYAPIEAVIGQSAFWDMNQTSLRWKAFRYNNLSHNVLTFNGKYQLVTDTAKLENYLNTVSSKTVDVVLTPIYKNEVKSYRRTASIVSSRYVEIKDVVQAGSTTLSTVWNMVTEAEPTIINNKLIRLKQTTKIIYLMFDGTASVTAEIRSTLPTTTYEEKNTGTSFVGFKYSIPANATQTTTVKLVPDGDPLLAGLLTNTEEQSISPSSLTAKAFYDAKSQGLSVFDLPEGTQCVKVFDLMGVLIDEIQPTDSTVKFTLGKVSGKMLILQLIDKGGRCQTLKVIC